MVKDKFNHADASVVPSDWYVYSLVDVCAKITDGEHLTPKTVEIGKPIISAKDVKKKCVDFRTVKYVSINDFEKFTAKCNPQNGDVLLVSRGATIGRGTYVDTNKEFCLMGSVILIKPEPVKVNGKFLNNYISSPPVQKQLLATSGSSAQQAIYLKDLKNLLIPIPPLPEQKRIAEILSTVDDAITKTDEIIEQTKRVKKGLIQELVTKGIGHTKFKETELGEIPVEWEVCELKDYCTKITDGSHFSPVSIDSSQYKICTVKNIRRNSLDTKNANCISNEDFEMLVQASCKPINGDVLLSKDGTVGLSLVFNQEHENLVVLSSIAIIRPKATLNSYFLQNYLSSSNSIRQLLNMKTGSAIKRIVLKDIKTLKVPVPSLEEQNKISHCIGNIDHKIDNAEKRKCTLERMKKGLMQDLLSGRVRVKV